MTRNGNYTGTAGTKNNIHLLGRELRVTECKVDSESAAKVLKIQKELRPSSAQVNVESQQEISEKQDNLESDNDDIVESENIIASPVRNPDPAVEKNLLQQEYAQASDVEADGCCFSQEKKIDFDVAKDLPYIDETTGSAKTLIKYDQDAQSEKVQRNEKGFDDDNVKYSIQAEANPDIPVPSNIIDEVDAKPTLVSGKVIIDDGDVANQDEEVTSDTWMSSNAMVSVTGKIDIEEYSQFEWKGTTYNAELMRLGYAQIKEATGCSAMRIIRGDNYCGLRATSFQILSQDLRVLQAWKSIEDILEVPQKLKGCNWITHWNFAGRLRVSRKKKLETMYECLKCFCNELQKARSIENTDERIKYFLKYFNSDEQDEVLLFEALKLLMLHSAVLLYDDYQAEKQVPEFTWLLFARDTSQNPEQLMKNHLNSVGDSGGLEQIEMFLLGYALNLTIRVVRPSKVHDDFMTFYPDDHKDEWDVCNLIAEDDRHYNIIVP